MVRQGCNNRPRKEKARQEGPKQSESGVVQETRSLPSRWFTWRRNQRQPQKRWHFFSESTFVLFHVFVSYTYTWLKKSNHRKRCRIRCKAPSDPCCPSSQSPPWGQPTIGLYTPSQGGLCISTHSAVEDREGLRPGEGNGPSKAKEVEKFLENRAAHKCLGFVTRGHEL